MKSAEPSPLPMKERLRELSMVSTLTFFHALSSAFILFVICIITYIATARDLESRNDDYIDDEIKVLLALLQAPDAKAHLQNEIGREQLGRMHVVHYVRILDKRGGTIIEDPKMDSLLPASIFPPATRNGSRAKHSLKYRALDGNIYRLMSIDTPISGFGPEADFVQIAFDITSLEEFYTEFRLKLAVLLVVGVLLSTLAGYLSARRGLSPLARITHTAKQITITRLDERIFPRQWPRELAELARHFNGMLDRLKESFEGLHHYTANLAHELRTPINNLMIEGDLALLRERTPAEYQKVIGSSMEEYERLSRLIDSLLFLARFDSSAEKVKQQQIDVGNELERMSEFYSAFAMEKGIGISCRGGASLTADPVLFRRALSNLMSNALKYTPAGGRIEVSAQTRNERSVEVAVRDTGFGIEAEQLPQIFDRFYRAGRAEDSEIQGYGLGLSIVKAIMAMHGGEIEVESEPGRGTSITLVFPPSELSRPQ